MGIAQSHGNQMPRDSDNLPPCANFWGWWAVTLPQPPVHCWAIQLSDERAQPNLVEKSRPLAKPAAL